MGLKQRKIITLNGSQNYKSWSEEIMFLLLEKNCWDATQLSKEDSLKPIIKTNAKGDVISTESNEDFAKRMKSMKEIYPDYLDKESKAKGILMGAVGEDFRESIIQCKTSAEVWTTLKEKYGTKTDAQISLLFNEYINKDWDQVETIDAHCNYLEARYRELKGTTLNISPQAQVQIFMKSLGRPWDTFLSTLRARYDFSDPVISGNYNLFKEAVLVEEEILSRTKKDKIKSANNVKTKKKRGAESNKVCENCEKRGHTENNCWLPGGGDEGNAPWQKNKERKDKKETKNKDNNKPKEKEKEKDKKKIGHVLTVRSILYTNSDENKYENSTWIIDSGATDHYCNNISKFKNIKKLKNPIVIYVANNKSEIATHQGEVEIFTKPNKERLTITLTNVLYVKTLGLNLISVVE
jgi:hypothetical protein